MWKNKVVSPEEVLERIEPGKPQQNSRHERMHKTLKECTALPPRSSLEAQQKAFDRFMKEYNYERPHEALDVSLHSNGNFCWLI